MVADDEMQMSESDEPGDEEAVSDATAEAVDGDEPEAVSEDAPEAADGDEPEAAGEDAPEAADGDEPEAAGEDAPEAADGDEPEAVSEDVPEAADGDEPEAVSEDAPEAADGDEPEAGSEDAPEASEGAETGAVSQDDIDRLFSEEGGVPEPTAATPAGGGAVTVGASALELLGDAARAIVPLAGRALETLTLGVESATGQQVTIASASVEASEYSTIEQEFAAIPHMGFELRVSLSETESHLAGGLISLPDAGALFSLETAPEQMEEAEFAQGQVEAAAGTLRELLDLVSLTLFTEQLSAVEVTLSDQRMDQIEFTMGIVADVAQGAAPLRIDLVMALAGGIPATLTLVVPSNLATRLAEELESAPEVSEEAAQELPEPTPISAAPSASAEMAASLSAVAGGADAGASMAGAGAAPEMAGAGAVPEMAGAGAVPEPREATTIGASAGVDVHPVRFPPLPDPVSGGPAHSGLDLIMDVQMRVTVELGRSTMTVEDVLSLGPGSVVELNKLAGEPVDILVNSRLIARGEVVVVDENFGVRVTEIVSPRRRANAMGG